MHVCLSVCVSVCLSVDLLLFVSYEMILADYALFLIVHSAAQGKILKEGMRIEAKHVKK